MGTELLADGVGEGGKPGFLFFSIYFIDYALTVVPISPLGPPLPITPSVSSNPPTLSSCLWVMGHPCKFFGFSIFYIVLNIPLSILYLPVCTS